MPRHFDEDGHCLSCGYKRLRPADASCRWPGRHNVGKVTAGQYRRWPSTNPFDVDGYCRSCGYRRTRAAAAGCTWPTKHDPGRLDLQSQAAALYAAGLSVARVTAALGSTRAVVVRLLDEANVTRRSLSEAWSPSSTAPFDRDRMCRSCGYGRDRPPVAECAWPREHSREQ